MEGDELYLMLLSAVRTVFIREGAMRRNANLQDCNKILDLWSNKMEEINAQNQHAYDEIGDVYVNKQTELFQLAEELGDIEMERADIYEKIEGLNNLVLNGIVNGMCADLKKVTYIDGYPSSNFFSMNTKTLLSDLSGLSDLSESLDETPAPPADPRTSYHLATPSPPPALPRPTLSRGTIDLPSSALTRPTLSRGTFGLPSSALPSPPPALPRPTLSRGTIDLPSSSLTRPTLSRGTFGLPSSALPSPPPALPRPTLSRGTIGLPSSAPPAGVPIISPPKAARPLRGTLVQSPTLPLQVLQAAVPPQQDSMNRRQVLQASLPSQRDSMNRRQVLQAALPPRRDSMNRRQVLQQALPPRRDSMNRRQVLGAALPPRRDSMNRRQELQAALQPQQDLMNRRQPLDLALPPQQDLMNRRQVLHADLPPQPENAEPQLFDDEWFRRAQNAGAQVMFAPTESPPPSPGESDFSDEYY